MLELAICILEVIVLLLTVKVLWCLAPRGMYVSDPSIGAAIGNAANRNFENSQASVMGISNRGFMRGNAVGNRMMWPQNKPIAGYMSPPETLVWTNGGNVSK